ncbi:hypothetical protein [Burkholderia cenocepacia]|uniref:hypothetical protein n=1 Tax=Burkholderia cenocepacia TaxID=95486 RepID=UPI001BAC8BCD|nr:hypothetical protein [Burkholderia cenocepacia]
MLAHLRRAIGRPAAPRASEAADIAHGHGRKKAAGTEVPGGFLLLVGCSSDGELRVRDAARGGDRLAHHFCGARRRFLYGNCGW